mmetsp:Transcript_17380/g.25968  ORF Transcript_17380/g.25968 Transcript_17380/m.25968 type:complete len:520 (+) Transcript_17380:250-1809(+)|eukprot:CAMPEP_0203663002 /NCGR_PEP_ID=MMETSP0090-20130426/766_1 /ASSEMBLY_ACC=CAM_ASM_001088 /TAXON_ID=426623 /ORGANISM="Chaetoceros affinis, Strain CCMP159" /LENGTH=519 /DNA_ID=CAMNT_0050525861 /DNA_START=151 /DNA_END=1710 /DNA_ORIENTATION=-
MKLSASRKVLGEKSGDSNPSLRSLVTSWSTIALIAIVATAITVHVTPNNDQEIELEGVPVSLFDLRKLATEVREHFAYEHHEPLFPLKAKDYRGFFFAIIGLMIAAGGGIGGGGILVPIYILVMGFSPKHAIPLSNITVFGGAMANTYLNAKKRHPLADRPLVDWDLILIMEPLTIAGALIGAFLNKLLREEVLAVMLVLLLTFTAYNTLKKAMKMYKAESRQLKEASTSYAAGESELTSIAAEVEEEDEEEAEEALLDDVDGENKDEEELEDVEIEQNTVLQNILERERTPPMGNITLLVVMFVVVLFINLMKGGGAFPSPLGIKCGSTSFWAANFINLGWIFMISLMARSYLLNQYRLKESCGYKYVEGDIKWTPKATITYPIICTFAGFFAGMFGVGGGIVKGPLMLAMGVHPKVSSASSACMILFTSFTATTSFVVFGLLIPDYAVVCLIIGFVATFVGQVALNYLMKKYQRNSYIAFSIGGVVLLSSFLMTIQSMISIAEGTSKPPGGVCGTES